MKTIRKYNDYESYVAHQIEKTMDPKRVEKWKTTEWESKIDGFLDVFNKNKDIIKSKAICLGARTGQEVEALKRIGIDAIGIDFVSFPPLVIKGDVHNVDFPDGSFSFVFSNIFDHVLYPEKFISEIERILCSGGHCLLHIQSSREPDEYAENFVDNIQDVIWLFNYCETVRESKIHYRSFLSYNREIVMRKNEYRNKKIC